MVSSSSSALSRLSSITRHVNPSHVNKDVVASIKISPQVSEALSNGRAVVALESTIISLGMPCPKNLDTAMEVEAIMRENGAVPATIAILDGTPCVGLTIEEREKLARLGPRAQKTARRDIAWIEAGGGHIVATRGTGATIVSATMIFAHMVGITLFVTGGIGGVHQHGEHSKKHNEFVQLPYKTNEFPAFFTEASGCKVPCRVDTPDDCARLIDANLKPELGTGMLTANLIESAIQRALREARDKNVTGNAATPFLLARVNELTGGASPTSNIALVKNNALLGAKISVALSQIRVDCTYILP